MCVLISWCVRKNILNLHSPKKKGPVAERLGRGLQNLVQRFESARDLQKSLTKMSETFFVYDETIRTHPLNLCFQFYINYISFHYLIISS